MAAIYQNTAQTGLHSPSSGIRRYHTKALKLNGSMGENPRPAMEAGEDDTDTAPPPLVVRRADLLSLEIETYIDLSAAKLKERFAPDQGKPQPEVPEAPKKPAGQSSSKWTATDTELSGMQQPGRI
ncbi:hypothetical protein B0H10DRAFT_1947130 [Mycena sp. CBHHK59/15]|nr:hypothetical protein B0H10DRAFT_1947130 [Mycena sp. CBHHK59/15]